MGNLEFLKNVSRYLRIDFAVCGSNGVKRNWLQAAAYCVQLHYILPTKASIATLSTC